MHSADTYISSDEELSLKIKDAGKKIIKAN
jgi:hypothetical protein